MRYFKHASSFFKLLQAKESLWHHCILSHTCGKWTRHNGLFWRCIMLGMQSRQRRIFVWRLSEFVADTMNIGWWFRFRQLSEIRVVLFLQCHRTNSQCEDFAMRFQCCAVRSGSWKCWKIRKFLTFTSYHILSRFQLKPAVSGSDHSPSLFHTKASCWGRRLRLAFEYPTDPDLCIIWPCVEQYG